MSDVDRHQRPSDDLTQEQFLALLRPIPAEMAAAKSSEAANWLERASDLLGEPDPGPTPWLVEGLIVDGAIVAAVGRWKTTKSYAMLDIAIAIVTGLPAFGVLEIPKPGPVVFVCEESGRAALWRRLDSLARGRAISREQLADLHVAPNQRVRLDDSDWQAELLRAGASLEPRLFVFDPLARMKAPGRNENAQNELATLIEFCRDLRDQSGAGVAFVHHTGHQGDQMRGSSDLESVWESRLTFKRDGESRTVDLSADHREAEPSQPIRYRLDWDHDTRSMRLHSTAEPGLPSLGDRLIESIRQDGPGTTDELRARVGVRKADVLRTLEQLEQRGWSASLDSEGAGTSHGTVHRGQSGRLDRAGRPIRDKVWKLSDQAGLWPVPDSVPTRNGNEPGIGGSVGGPPS